MARTGSKTVNFAGTLIFQGFLLFSKEKVVSNFCVFPTFLSETEVSLQQKQDQNKTKISRLLKWCQIHSRKMVTLKKVTPLFLCKYSNVKNYNKQKNLKRDFLG